MPTRKKQLKELIRMKLEAHPNPYGFGRDYTLVLTKGKLKDKRFEVSKIRKFWLGQDVKVFSRALGMRMEDAVEYYSKKAKSEQFEKVAPYIAKDIVKVALRKSPEEPLTQKDLKKIMKEAEDWSLSVQ